MTPIARRPFLMSAAFGLMCTLARVSAAPGTHTPPSGKPGDFDFLTGEWRIANRQRQADGSWKDFAGEATVHSILGGIGSVEELRIPVGSYLGMGLRLLDLERRVWSDFWVGAKSGVLTPPGQEGGFVDGVGTFLSQDQEEGKPVLYRGVWDRITPRSCRWRQGSSRDGGKSWDETWFMDWSRIG